MSLSAFDELLKILRTPEKKMNVSGLIPASAAWVIARLFQACEKTIACILPTSRAAEDFAKDLDFFVGDQFSVRLFPNLDVLPYFQLSPHPDVLSERLKILSELLSSRKPVLVVSSEATLLRRLPPKEVFNTYADYLVSREEIDRDRLLHHLVESGYLSVPLVEDGGTFSVRGSILDLFPPQSEKPYRIEFFGDQIESIRLFDPQTQRSLKEVDELILLPAREIVLNEKTAAFALEKLRARFDDLGTPKALRDLIVHPLKNQMPFAGLETFLSFFYEKTDSFLDYLKDDTLFFRWDVDSAFEHKQEARNAWNKARLEATSPEQIVEVSEILIDDETFENKLKRFKIIEAGQWKQAQQDETKSKSATIVFNTETHETLRLKIMPATEGAALLDPLIDFFKDQQNERRQILFTASSEAQKHRFIDLLKRHDLAVEETFSSSLAHFLAYEKNKNTARSLDWQRGKLLVSEGRLSEGFSLANEPFLWVTDTQIFGPKARRSRKTETIAEAFTSLEELKEGDAIVHVDHGVGLYKKLTRLEWETNEVEFLLIEYLGGDKLYLPIYRLNKIQRYTAEADSVPLLDKLGSTQWAKTKERVKKAIQKMAGELLKIYAARATHERPAYSIDTELFEEFEASFPYEETPDQEAAIHDVSRDLESEKPMDRLICGDVGFGKTEVALRAAFKAVLAGRQVAVLVPTTILAFQHFETFEKRMKPFGVNVKMLSRFGSTAEHKETLKKVATGEVQVLIGTHRLLQPDLKFLNLGLLIIDEEHRFGVAHKEKIKKLKHLVDVLTLTATPIPRTLNISLFGIRDLSIINTPPADRVAVRTYVAHFDEALIREAILREIGRGGQVFFIHNRVQTLTAMVERLSRIVPEAKIGMAHGQMTDEELETAMLGFLNKETQVLVCTTIVESGIDFPSANTILINRADTLGLAQLYQLRGRVGRSNLRAFCYLLIPAETAITPDAKSRLAVLQRFTELGSGFKIAAHDMEIRGTGNLLGSEQHGNLKSIGYELYLKLLEETIQEMKGEKNKIEVDPELNFKVTALLPEEYIPTPSLRLGFYQRLSNAADEEALGELKQEMIDRFGKAPNAALQLLSLMRIRLLAKKLLIESIHQEAFKVIYKFHPQSPLGPDVLLNRMKKSPKDYQLTPDLKWVTPQREKDEEKILEGIYRFLLELESESGKDSL